ncbi:MAG: HipA domain-containing protein [Candidatus Kryptoniota bacterium]
MNRCPITYQPCGDEKYSKEGLRLLSRSLATLDDIPLSQEDQLKEAAARATKMSIQGIQPKLSAILNVRASSFEIVDRGGRIILKPQSNLYAELPENEDVTMRLAKETGLDVPLHGMVYSVDRRLTYFVQRFDRHGRDGKYSLEDFAQLAGKSRDTKYDYSMEKAAEIVETYCTFPLIEKVKLFKLTLFNFLVGNEDQHLKNFSLITRSGKVSLSPVYDLINTTIALVNPEEEIALPLSGKKRNLTRQILIDYWGRERLGLNERTIENVTAPIRHAIPRWNELIENSFLSDRMKKNYFALLAKRTGILF